MQALMPAGPGVERAGHRGSQGLAGELLAPPVFARVVLAHLLLGLPSLRTELAQWTRRAAQIPSPSLRTSALRALAKQGNIEGAALFATLAPIRHSATTVRALVAYQAAYNYLDALSELPSADPTANAQRLHQALLVALDPGAPHLDYYEHHPESADGGYLIAMLDRCRAALGALPSFALLAPTARVAASRIVDFQTLNLAERHGGHDALERWAREIMPAGCGLRWWEVAAAAGSSLPVHALIAAGADPLSDARAAGEIDRAYFPCLGALHSLLDSLVDRGEDEIDGRLCLLDNYTASPRTATRLGALATQARAASARLPSSYTHRVILTAMSSYYLSAPECATPEARAIASTLKQALGAQLGLAVVMFRAKRLLHALAGGAYA